MRMPEPGRAMPHEYVEAGWCRGNYARNADGEDVDVIEGNVASVCAVGSLQRFIVCNTPREGTGPIGFLCQIIAETREIALARCEVGSNHASCGHRTLSSFNDCPYTTQEEVVESLRVAAETGGWAIIHPLATEGSLQ